MLKALFLFTWLSQALWSHTAFEEISNLEGSLQTLVDGKVSAISGGYVCYEKDFSMPSLHPIEVTRVYNCHLSTDRVRSANWIFNYFTLAECRLLGPDCHFKLRDEFGTTFWGNNPMEGKIVEKPLGNSLKKGETNVSRGLISGKTNLINYKCKTFLNGCEITDGNGQKKSYSGNLAKALYDRKNNPHEGIAPLYQIQQIDGSKIELKPIENHLVEILSYDPIGSLAAKVTFQDSKEKDFLKQSVFFFRTEDGRTFKYTFDIHKTKGKRPIQDGGWYGLLRHVEGTSLLKTAYRYEQDNSLQRLIVRNEPNHRYVKIDYYTPGHHYNEQGVDQIVPKSPEYAYSVRALYEPAGKDFMPICTRRFVYSKFNKTNRQEGQTDAYDAYDQLTTYNYNEEFRPTKICYFKGASPDLIDEMEWEGHNLKRRLLYSPQEKTFKGKTYVYDPFGNPLEETFWGNLTGTNIETLSFNQSEEYKKQYTYSIDGLNNKLCETLPNGAQTLYEYAQGTNRLICKKTASQTTSYSYHFCGALDEETTLDGPLNLTKKHVPKLSSPCYGYDKAIEEYAGNSFLKKTEFEYHHLGHLSKKSVYGSDKKLAYVETWSYDARGNCKEEVGPTGLLILRDYDDNNNLVREVGPDPYYVKEFYYDFMNRCTRKVERHPCWKRPLTTTYEYDYLGRCVEIIDFFSNSTKYLHDRYGRIIETTNPQGGITQTNYDVFNNVTSIVDGMGHEVKAYYTSYGKPFLIINNDASTESFIYNLDGTLREHTAPNQRKTLFEYDLEKKLIKKDATTFTYWGSFLTATTDEVGVVTSFVYDEAGNKVAEHLGKTTKLFSYDTLGRLEKTTYCEGQEILSVEVSVYDALGRIVQQWTEDGEGNRYLVREISYDVFGHLMQEKIDERITQFKYDPHGRLLEKIDADLSVTRYLYDFSDHLTKTTLLPSGIQIVETEDCLGQLVKIEKFGLFSLDPLITIVRSYDLAGHLVDEIQENKKVHYEYDSMGRLYLLLDEKRTEYQYNALGQQIALIKGDGNCLFYAYDEKGRVATLTSSDGSIHYDYVYDHADRITAIVDRLQGCSVSRSYTEEGFLNKEMYLDREFTYSMDGLGRRRKITYPDETTASYSYQALRLEKIDWKGYTHCYQNIDSYGMWQQELLIDGSVRLFSYDAMNRLKSIVHPDYSIEDIVYDAARNLKERVVLGERKNYSYDELNQLTEEEGYSYNYDALYNRIGPEGDYDVNGNLRSKGDLRFSYDALDRLIKVESPTGVWEYCYDGFHRRLKRNGEIFWYIDEIEVGREQEGELVEFRLLGETTRGEIGATIAIEIEGQVYVSHHDQSGNIVALGDQEIYSFSSFGEEERSGAIRNPWRFSSKRVDPETGFVYFGRRFYDPTQGKFTSCDPLGYAAGINLHAFVRNNPLTHFDPNGLIEWSFSGLMDAFVETVCSTVEHIMHAMEPAMRSIFGMTPYEQNYKEESPAIFHVDGIAHPHHKHLVINGMCNEKLDTVLEGVLNFQKKIGGYELDVLFNVGQGVFQDLIRCGHEFYGGKLTECCRLLDEYLSSTKKDVIITTFSEGGIVARNYFKSYEGDKSRIRLELYGSPCYISRSIMENVVHINSDKDFVTRLDLWGKIQNRDRIVECKSSWLLPFEHYFLSETYSNQFQPIYKNDVDKINSRYR